MLKRLFFALMLLTATFEAAATDYTDIWYIPAESGWGVNVVESDAFLFLTFFIYGPDNKPTWYVANLTQDANGNFGGPLYLANGTYFALPWVPPPSPGDQVGTASFQPTSAYTAQLSYAITNGPMVTKAIQRQTLTPIHLTGIYSGGVALSQTACATTGTGDSSLDIFVTHSIPNGTVSIIANYPSGLSCTFAGNITQAGKLYRAANASYVCNDGRNTTAVLDELTATAHGIEGVWTAPVGEGCIEQGIFGGVRK
jgi:hypothetical protein